MEHITSAKNPKILEFSKLFLDKKHRQKSQLFVCEGEKMLFEAVSCGVIIDTIIISENLLINLDEISAKKILVSHHIIEKISDTKTPQGILFSCKFTEKSPELLNKFEKILVLDSVADPGNIGTLIRSAVSFGIEALVLLNSCAEVTSPKVVRATMGGIFKIPIFEIDAKTCFENIKVPVFATILSEKSVDISTVSLEKATIILGNEARGVSKEVLEFASREIIIPMQNTESLNVSVAGSIVMWEMFKCQQF